MPASATAACTTMHAEEVHTETAETPESADAGSLRERVASLLVAIDTGDTTRKEQLLEEIARSHESGLFIEMGRITRQLHEALAGVHFDPALTQLAEHDIPDAKARLDFVIEKTEQAAHRTLGAVESALPLCSELAGDARRLDAAWAKFLRRELSADEFRALSRELPDFFQLVERDSTTLSQRLSDVLMAQDFQDLTGQVIRRIIDLVQNVERHLVDLLRLRGGTPAPQPGPCAAGGVHAEGPQVAGAAAANVVHGQDEVDELLSSLGF